MGKLPPVTIRSVAGLWNSPNPFSKVPEGALATADDTVIRANGVLEPRRGFDRDVVSFAPGQFTPYRVFPLASTYVGVVVISPAGNQTFTVYNIANPALFPLSVTLDGTPPLLSPYSMDTRVNITAASANQNLMVMSRNGPETIPHPLTQSLVESFSEQRLSGLPRCPAPAVTLIAAAGNAVLNTAKRRTYRATVAWYDSRGNFYESAPSEPVFIDNTSGVDKTPQLTFFWPLAAHAPPAVGTAGAFRPFFRLWRALETANGVPANDEMFLTREIVPASYTENAQGFIDPNTTNTVNDVSVDSLLNVPLYTNPQTGDGFGIADANRRPPVGAFIAYFKGRMYYARPTYQQQLAIQIIGTGTGGIAPGDTITIDGITYTAGGAGLENTRVFNCPTGAGAVASNIETTARSLVECIRQAYGTAGGPGYARQINRQLYAYYASSDVNDFGRIVIERPLPISTQDDSAIGFSVVTTSPGVRFPGGTTSSADDYTPGGLSWSKPDQPEAVPDVNFQIVGDADRAMLGFSVHRDAMVIYKEDGAYILRDDGGPQPSIDLLDTSVICIAPASIAVVSNLAYLLTTRGVLQISEQGTELMSFPIYEDIDKLFRLSTTQLATAYGIAHEGDRLYVLGVPASAQETTCSYQYVLRVPEADSPLPKWTRWRLPGSTHGCVVPLTKQVVLTFQAVVAIAGVVSKGIMIEKRGNVVSLDYQDTWLATVGLPAPATISGSIALTGDYRPFIGTGDLLRYNPVGVGTKVYTPRVVTVAYNSTTNQTTLMLDSIYPFSGATFQTIPAIRSRWRFLPIVAGEPTMEKQHTYVQGYFSYFDGDWLDMKLDSEGSILSPFSKVYSDPQNSNLGGTIALSFPGGGTTNPAPPTPCGQIQWLRNCRDVVLRLDPGRDEARGARIGVEMQFAQAQARFQLAAISIAIGEVNDTGAR